MKYAFIATIFTMGLLEWWIIPRFWQEWGDWIGLAGLVWLNGALVGVVWLIESLTPGDRIRKIYLILVVFPLFVMVEYGLLSVWLKHLGPPSYIYGYLGLEVLMYQASVVFGFIMAILIGLVSLRIVFIDASRTFLLYSTVAFASLGISAGLVTLFRIMFGYYATNILIVLVAALATVLVGTLRRPYRHAIAWILVLCAAMILIGWWIWVRIWE